MICHHCGQKCPKGKTVFFQDHPFCCLGCKTVCQIIQNNDLGAYYQMNQAPGVRKDLNKKNHYDFLDHPGISSQFILYQDDKLLKTQLSIPQIHCSSCLWLLENLGKFSRGIVQTQVNFSKKELLVTLNYKEYSLKDLFLLLDQIGYTPELKKQAPKKKISSNYYRIGIAGFCFGNIMLLAFPEYLTTDASFESFKPFFGYLSLLLALPVFFYSGYQYLLSAFRVLYKGMVSMDVPIAMGMITLLLRSAYEILTQTGAGYLDSLSGFIFFLLIGKSIQQRTYQHLIFNRDYKSYFPIGVTCLKDDQTTIKKIEALEPEDIIILRNNELIPADGLLLSDYAQINYSFVTGESNLAIKKKGDQVLAGGRIHGQKVSVILKKRVNNSYLTQLWNQEAFNKNHRHDRFASLNDLMSRYFTWVVLAIAFFSGLYWFIIDPSRMWQIITAVLIVACPCALALTVPLTFGNLMQLMGQNGAYLKNNNIIERLAGITDIILDKTGTLTYSQKIHLSYHGTPLNQSEKNALASIVINSAHPLSMAIYEYLQPIDPTVACERFNEVIGKGLEATVSQMHIRLGSASFLQQHNPKITAIAAEIHLSIDDTYKGYFEAKQAYRPGLYHLARTIQSHFGVHLLSGDNDGERDNLQKLLNTSDLYFNLSPIEKMDYVKTLQKSGKQILMAGDGLNDAGALKQSDVGIAISDAVHQFSPACDIILQGDQIHLIHYLIQLSKQAIRIVKCGFSISITYNIIGLFFAITGSLSPIIAAILMPLSAISVVVFSQIACQMVHKRLFKRYNLKNL